MSAIGQMTVHAAELLPAGSGNVLDWKWPVAPATLTVYDKYSGTSHVIRADEPTWTFSYKGGAGTIVFADGGHGALQRRLALLTAGRESANHFHRTARLLVQHWDTVAVLLCTRPKELKAAWDIHASTLSLAGLFKKVQKFACAAHAGHWNSRTLPLVNSLDTRANADVARRTSRREARHDLVSPALQADIVNVLDAAAMNEDLSLFHLEGAAALALIFQHGVRPVQVLCLDVRHSRKSIQHYLGHGYEHSSAVYVRASLQQAELINSALGASKLYGTIRRIALKDFVTLEEVLAADEDRQIGGIVGGSLIGGLGLCRAGQSHCHYNPVTSCYGCQKFIPSLDRHAHHEAVEGMRQQVRLYLTQDAQPESPAYRQLTRALAGAQRALDAIEKLQAQ